MPKRSSRLLHFRVQEGYEQAISEAAGKHGQDRSSFIRQAIDEKLHRDRDTEAIVATIKGLNKDIRGIRSVLAMIFALQRETVREVFIRVREPQGEALQDALNRLDAQERKLLANVVKEYQGGELKRIMDAE